jgi:hypothetical protein
MVTRVFISALSWNAMLAAPKDPLLRQLEPQQRVAVVMALLALVITGLFLVTCVMLGAHWVRRLARHKPGVTRSHAVEAAAQNQQLRTALKSVLPEVKTDETVQLGRMPNDTKVDS